MLKHSNSVIKSGDVRLSPDPYKVSLEVGRVISDSPDGRVILKKKTNNLRKQPNEK